VIVLVNRRPVTNRTLTYAVVEAYGSLVPVGRQPVAVINVQVPPGEVDFNVHPSKLEVKLLRERAVYATIQRALRSALATDEWSVATWSSDEDPDRFGGAEELRALRVLGQAGKMYVIAEGEAGVYLVDQHAAHERVLLEDLRAALVGRSDHDIGGVQPQVDLGNTQGSDTVSRLHATIEHIGSSYTLTDLNSTNATRLNGKRLEPDKATPMNDGDALSFGKVTCTFKQA